MFPTLPVGLLQRSSRWVVSGGFGTESFYRSTVWFLSGNQGFCTAKGSFHLQEASTQRRHPQQLSLKRINKGKSGAHKWERTGRTNPGWEEVVGGLSGTPSPLSPLVFEVEEKNSSSMERSTPAATESPRGLSTRFRANRCAIRFWEGCLNEAYCALYHPFVMALAGGTLHSNSFQRYIAQDFYFLGAFAEAYGLAIENTDDSEAKVALQRLKDGVQEELDQVHSFVVTSDSKAAASIQPNSATLAYVNFLMDVAKGQCLEELQVSETTALAKRRRAAYTIAAMTPCMTLYAFLGQEMKKALKDTSSGEYAQWINTYASAEFASSALLTEQVLDRLAMPFPGEIDVEAMESLYRRAMELEMGFFAVQEVSSWATGGRPVPVPLFVSELASNFHFVLMSDFDLTCTVSDSCPALADMSVSTLQREIAAGGRAMSSSESLRKSWNSLVDQYMQEYTQLLDRLLSGKELSPKEPQQEKRTYDPKIVRQVSEALSELETPANARVVEARVLSGMSVADVKQAGGSIPLREGCKGLLRRISGDTLPVDFHILSVCWSRRFIEGAFLGDGLEFPNIHSNELEFSDQGISTGKILKGLETAVDKEKCFTDIVNRTEEKLADSGKTAFTVYVGDSVTDLLCLLKADIGIVVGDSSSLKRVADAAGIMFLPLYSGLLQQQQEECSGKEGSQISSSLFTKREGVLYRISNWHELHAFLVSS